MGWMKYLLLGDFGQQLDLSEQKAEIDQLRHELRLERALSPTVESAKAADTVSRFDFRQLQNEHDEVRLYLAALVRLLASKGVLTPEELNQCARMVDSEDGAEDGSFGGRIA